MSRACPVAILITAAVLAGMTTARAQTVFSYRCRDGTRFAAMFYAGVRVAYLRLDGKALTLPRRVSAAGARYSRNGVTLRVRGRAATLTRGRTSTECLRP